MSYIYNLTDTWNSAGTTFNAIKMDVTDTASAAVSLLMNLQVGGANRFSLIKSGVGVASGEWQAPSIWATSQLYIGSGADTTLARDAANTLAQRNGTNAQTFRVYKTFTDTSNYLRVALDTTGQPSLMIQSAGTGGATNFEINNQTAGAVAIATNGTSRWQINSSGNFIAATDGTYDIGSPGANRPRRVFASDYLLAANNVNAGGNAANIGSSGIQAASSVTIGFSSTTGADGAQDVTLARDAADTLAMRRTTNAQTFRLYNTFTDASNYERAIHIWAGNIYAIRTQGAGTGVARDLEIYAGIGANLSLGANNTQAWRINTSGHFITLTDNAYDIGASGASRPRNIYFAGGLIGGYIQAASGSGISWVGRSSLTSPSDSIITLTNAALTDFSRLQFGGTTNAFPALGRSGTTLRVLLADGSTYAPLEASAISGTASVAARTTTPIPAGGTAGVGFVFSSTANFGVFFGSGAPTLSAAKGSLYLRSDGTTTNDRMYVNTDGATTWTAVTTAA